MKRRVFGLLVMALCAYGSGACGAGNTTTKAKPKPPPKLNKAPPPDELAYDVGKPATIAVSPTFACAIRKDTGVACWGDNRAGQLGQGDDLLRSGVQVVAGMQAVVEVAAGARHACARKDNGEVWCWGDGGGFRLGAKLDAKPYKPRKVAEVRQAVALAVGDDHSCAATVDGALRCWGSHEGGKLGLDHVDHVTEPANVALDVKRVSGVALTATSTCVRDGAGRVHCWGLGDTMDANQRMTMDALKGVTTLYANDYQTCARLKSGDVKCWRQPSELAPLARVDVSVTEVALLEDEVCGLSQQELHCWKDGRYGDPDPDDARAPVALQNAVEIRAAGAVKCARDKDGQVHCWGTNSSGQLGQPRGGLYPAPVEVSPPGGIRKVYVAGGETCAVGTDGRFRCWGTASSSGQLFRLQPLPGRALASVSSAAVGSHRCAVTKGQVACWGSDTYGQLGVVSRPQKDGLDSEDEDVAHTVEESRRKGEESARKGEESRRKGEEHARKKAAAQRGAVERRMAMNAGILSLLSTSSVSSGYGIGSTWHQAKPVIGLSAVTDVAVSLDATCALTAAGVRCWGDVGDPGVKHSAGGMGGPCGGGFGATVDPHVCEAYRKPRPIDGVDAVKALVGHRRGFCVLRQDQRAQCFANGAADEPWGRDLRSIFSGHERVCAIDGGGKLSCNRKYRYDVDDDPFGTPLRAWAGGHRFECAVTRKGRVLCVGKGAKGQLGDGRAQDAKAPVEVAGITDATRVYAGSTHACALRAGGALVCWGSAAEQMGRRDESINASDKPVVVAIDD